MMDGFDENPDRIVKARWLAIGLSQTDLVEILDAALEQVSRDADGSNGVDADRLAKIAEALNISADAFNGHAVRVETDSSSQGSGSLQSLLELRLLQALQSLRDHRIKWMLVHLAERLVKRENNRHGDAS
jgi:transcriptional regulator with XRE-family HTH domain